MATTPVKNTATKKVAAKKSPAKKVAARKTATRKSPAKKVAAKKTVTRTPVVAVKPATEPISSFVNNTANLTDAATEQVDTAIAFMRGVVHTSIGLPFVLQARFPSVEMPSVEMPKFEMPKFTQFDLTTFDLAPIKELLTEAKAEGSARVTALQSVVAPAAAGYAKRVEVRVESLVDMLEAPLPEQVREYVATSRKRVRDLVAA